MTVAIVDGDVYNLNSTGKHAVYCRVILANQRKTEGQMN